MKRAGSVQGDHGRRRVAPRTGARIETRDKRRREPAPPPVAPRTGARIETFRLIPHKRARRRRRPPHGGAD